MEENFSLNSYLDPIAKVWGGDRPELPSEQFKAQAKNIAHNKESEDGHTDRLSTSKKNK